MQTLAVTGTPRLIIDVPSAILDVTTHDGLEVTVEVRPARLGRQADQRAAERLEVTQSGDTIGIAHNGPRFFGLGTAHVRVAVPVGTEIDARTGNGAVTFTGPLGQCMLRTANGSVRVDSAAGLRAHTANGPVTVGRVDGRAELSTSNGSIEVGEVLGDAELKTSNGDIRVAGTLGRLGAKTSAGSISVGRSGAETVLKTSAGAIRVGRVEGGSLTASTSVGEIDADVAPGVSVWVDASTKAGSVINDLTATAGPVGERTAELRLTSSLGTIRLRRLPEAA